MIKMKIQNYIMILTEEHEKYQHYYLEALIDMNIRQVKVYCF